jgi:hypothetical protein
MTATTTERSSSRKPREKESRQPDFVVRAKTGPGRKDWTTLGYAWARENGEGFSVKLNAMPIGTEWGGVLKLLPPFAAESEIPDEN